MRGASRIVLSLAAVGAALVIYSQTRAFAWDEGFHLLTAQLITRGRRPYLDFCFSQTPLNAYWNAGWMLVFGDTWRTAHAVAAVMTWLATGLTAAYLLWRFPEPRWRLPLAIQAVFLVGFNLVVFEFGTIGQAYGLCLFLIVSAYLCAVAAANRCGALLAAAAGLLSSAAANSSLLTAPVAPVLLLWILCCNRAGSRIAKAAAFAGAAAIACGPLAWLYIQGSSQTVFNVFEYNFLYRQRHWANALDHNIGEWTAWIASPQAIVLGALAVAGLLFVRGSSGWERPLRREFYLCAWLAAALIAHISTALPTFTRYYLLAVPFLAILAGAGLYSIGGRLAAPDRPFWPAALVCILFIFCLGRSVYQERDDFSWSDEEPTAAKVREVTPPGAVLLADEPTYFVSRRPPPSGMELADSHKLDFPADVAARLHVVPQPELDRRIRAGVFDVIQTSEDEQRIKELGLPSLYEHSAEFSNTHVFWGRKTAPAPR